MFPFLFVMIVMTTLLQGPSSTTQLKHHSLLIRKSFKRRETKR